MLSPQGRRVCVCVFNTSRTIASLDTHTVYMFVSLSVTGYASGCLFCPLPLPQLSEAQSALSESAKSTHIQNLCMY